MVYRYQSYSIDGGKFDRLKKIRFISILLIRIKKIETTGSNSENIFVSHCPFIRQNYRIYFALNTTTLPLGYSAWLLEVIHNDVRNVATSRYQYNIKPMSTSP